MLTTAHPAMQHRVATMGIRGVKVTTFSGFEMKAFGGFYDELKKKVMWHSTNIASTWSSAIPAILGTYLLIKWAENSYHHKVRSQGLPMATAPELRRRPLLPPPLRVSSFRVHVHVSHSPRPLWLPAALAHLSFAATPVARSYSTSATRGSRAHIRGVAMSSRAG